MKPSKNCLNLIKHFEGFSSTPYVCSGGKLTIGYGHTATVKEGMEVTEEEAEDLLTEDLKYAAECVEEYCDVDLTQGQFDALCSFTFNLGCGAYRSSTLLRLINAGNIEAASQQFGRWVHGGGKVLPGLVKRREAERKLFNGIMPSL